MSLASLLVAVLDKRAAGGRCKSARPHRKVMIWWGKRWAIQYLDLPNTSIGFRIQWDRPLVDLYFNRVTFAVGELPYITDEVARQSDSCRGFFFSEEEIL